MKICLGIKLALVAASETPVVVRLQRNRDPFCLKRRRVIKEKRTAAFSGAGDALMVFGWTSRGSASAASLFEYMCVFV